jgi:hypothetical protein
MSIENLLKEMKTVYCKYHNSDYLIFLKEKERFHLFQLDMITQKRVLKEERIKFSREILKSYRDKEGLSLNAYITNLKPRRKGEVKRMNDLLCKIKTDDRYLINYIMQNLQEYDENGVNVTYSGFNL